MAEAHPVGFQWVMEAKKRGAKVIHVDPRFTRTSAFADLHVPVRAGADIAFVGGLINYVLTTGKFFREYVINYTNAATILTEDFADTEDLDGVFSGLDREYRLYDMETWRYQGEKVRPAVGQRSPEETITRPTPEQLRQIRAAGRGETHGSGGAACHPSPDTDETLQNPCCVFQVLKRHYARYTPEMVAEVTGVPQAAFKKVCELITENSGRERTTAFVYSVGWTHHTSDVCKHCTESACLDVCPTGALFRTEFGTVVVQDDVCNGCGYCVGACPFGVIARREEDGQAHKCTLCYDRLGAGMEPACAKACPTESIQFGPLDELREQAALRVADLRAAGQAQAQLYLDDPDDGIGGGGAFFLLLDEPEVYGLPPDPVVTTRDLPSIWKHVGLAAAGLVAAGITLSLGRRRR